MGRRRLRDVTLLVVALTVTACGAGAPSASPVPTATSWEVYSVEFCSAWAALFRGVGNPDTASGSDLSKALDLAVETSDGVEASRLAANITSELEVGRRHAAAAAGWPPAAEMMRQLDGVLVAYEAMIAAKAAGAKGDPNAVAPQIAFEQAGGITSWFAMLESAPAVQSARPSGATSEPCAGLPISP